MGISFSDWSLQKKQLKPWELLVEEIGLFLGKDLKKFRLVKIWQDFLLLAGNCAEMIHFDSELSG